MCKVKPSDLVDVFPWYSLAQNSEAEDFALALARHIAEAYHDRWLIEMDAEERGQVYRWASEMADRFRLPAHREKLVVDALYSPFAAARFALEWQKALERVYYGKKEESRA